MDLAEAIATAKAALNHWSEYLDENDRENECETYDAAADVLTTYLRLLNGTLKTS